MQKILADVCFWGQQWVYEACTECCKLIQLLKDREEGKMRPSVANRGRWRPSNQNYASVGYDGISRSSPFLTFWTDAVQYFLKLVHLCCRCKLWQDYLYHWYSIYTIGMLPVPVLLVYLWIMARIFTIQICTNW